MLSESDRAAILDDEVQRYILRGYRVINRTATSVQLVRPKRFSLVAALAWLLLLGIGLLIYLMSYAGQRDEAMYITVNADGRIMRSGNGGAICAACGFESYGTTAACRKCTAPL